MRGQEGPYRRTRQGATTTRLQLTSHFGACQESKELSSSQIFSCAAVPYIETIKASPLYFSNFASSSHSSNLVLLL